MVGDAQGGGSSRVTKSGRIAETVPWAGLEPCWLPPRVAEELGFQDALLPRPPRMPKVVCLATFLAELILVHGDQDVLAEPPLAVALACLDLAIAAFGQPPPICHEVVQDALVSAAEYELKPEARQLLKASQQQVRSRIQALWQRRPIESAVAEKWKPRFGEAWPAEAVLIADERPKPSTEAPERFADVADALSVGMQAGHNKFAICSMKHSTFGGSA